MKLFKSVVSLHGNQKSAYEAPVLKWDDQTENKNKANM